MYCVMGGDLRRVSPELVQSDALVNQFHSLSHTHESIAFRILPLDQDPVVPINSPNAELLGVDVKGRSSQRERQAKVRCCTDAAPFLKQIWWSHAVIRRSLHGSDCRRNELQ